MYNEVRHRGNTQWSYLGIDRIPKTIIGVYAFWCRDTGKCIYVGQALQEPIRERLLQHWQGSHSQLLQWWIQAFGDNLTLCYREVEAGTIDRLERRLIKRWNPDVNIVGRRR